MAEFTDINCGDQIQIVGGTPGVQLNPFPNPLKDPVLQLGIGPASIPGSFYANGACLIGSPQAFIGPEAVLMLSRPNFIANAQAATATKMSILKVTNKLNTGVPLPTDIWFGDPGIGMVGFLGFTQIMNILNATNINIVSPNITIASNEMHVGSIQEYGAKIRNGVSAATGAKADVGARTEAGPAKNAAPITAPVVAAKAGRIGWIRGTCSGNKRFDISHPEMSGKRVRHICAEGPEPGIYIRGRLKDSKRIELPDYWEGLVDYDTITVTLTAVGKPQHLYVKSIDKNEIIIDNRKGDECLPSCHYEVWVARWLNPKDHDEKLYVVYEGLTADDYPGDDCFDIS